VGFGLGLERLLLVLAAEGLAVPAGGILDGTLQVFVATTSDDAGVEGFRLLDRLRTGGISAVGEMTGRSLRAQMKSADRLGARFALILGEEELAAGRASVRDMRSGEQSAVALEDAPEHLRLQLTRG
jgi:histidyl-tRNA synthetase